MSTITQTLALGRQYQQAGDPVQAENLYRQILRADPANPDALFGLGGACHQMRKLDEAALYYEQVLCLYPRHAETHHSLGLVLQEQGKPAEAERCYRQAIRYQRDHVAAHNNLGNVLQAQGKLEEAAASFREALRLDPDFPDGHYNLGNVLQAQGKLEEAAACYREALRRNPHFAAASNNLGHVFSAQERRDEAVVCFREAARLQPDSAEIQYNLAGALREQGAVGEAAACYQRAYRLRPTFAAAYNNLGSILAQDGQPEEAAAHFREALRLDPTLADAHNNLGAILLNEGKAEEALRHYREALRLNPLCIPALSSLAIHGIGPLTDEEVDRIKALATDPRASLEEASQLHFALANLRNRAGAYDEAFALFRQGNALRRRHFQKLGTPFNGEEQRAFVGAMIATCDGAYFRRVEGFGLETEAPVFIVGMPRSGTTLVEQILASHPRVHGAGELMTVEKLSGGLPARLGAADRYPACLGRLDRATARATAEDYLAHITRLGGAAARVTDKMPSNFQHLGLIATLFPRARILHCCRNPLDVGLSCYVSYFESLRFSWDLEDIGCCYREYERLMAHWRQVLPLRMMDVVYEELVDNQEAVSRRLVDFCGLEWDDRCLAFHQNPRAIRTVSLLQVRQPIYRNSVGRWRRYAAHLQPLIDALGPTGQQAAGGG